MDRYARRAQFPSDLTIERVTREGRKLSYKLSVLQQPERARACGSGAKCMYSYLESFSELTLTII